MSDLNVTTIQNNNIAKTDKLLAFNNNDSKAASIQDVVQLVPGKMAVATCTTAGNVATKAVTCDDWTNKPGLSILVEFSNANSADNVTLSINNGTAIPVYYMNTATEQVSGGAIPAGAVVFTLNAAGNKFYAHVTKLIEGAGVKIDGSKIEAVNDLPTDAVLHYSFDDLPDYPDGTADVRLLNNNTYQIQSTSYGFSNNGNTTFSNENGNLKFVTVATGFTDGPRLNNDYYNGKIIKLRLNVISLTSGGRIDVFNGVNIDGVGTNIIKSITSVGTYEITLCNINNSYYKSVYIFTSEEATSEVIVEQIYIGDGSYSTPVIDNVNGQNNATNNGGIAVQGVSGKGARFFANKISPMVANVSSIMGDVTISAWCINYGNGAEYSLIISDEAGENSNWRLNFNNSAGSIIVARVGDVYMGPYNISANTLHHFVLTINGTIGKLYCDGILLGTVNNISNRLIANQLNIGGMVSNEFFRLNGMIDDLLIFDRALTEKEVIALYNNKANTPKYFSKADYLLEQIANNS